MELLLSDSLSVGFVGFGQMGAAIAQSIHSSFPSYTLVAVESNMDRQSWIQNECAYITLASYEDLFRQCHVVFLAIKPQHVHELSKDIHPFVTPEHCLISMLAGVSYGTCSELFQPAKMVRVMPNTPAKLSKGVTGIYFSDELDKVMVQQVMALCDCFGTTIQVKNDHDMDVITAISGSGPAFFYRMVDAFINFGVASGLNESLVKDAVIQTMIGAGHMLLDDPNPMEQIQRVASPNGTTQAGLEVMDQKEFDTLMSDVLHRAYNRAVELSKERK
ncbi:pyrroline-5-carboxylate reductase [Candidatus Marinamargulisbacteria bacterium SCGC AG-343-K17]|nr:pyrroline-5-carboxylate reductase [Candidatus Marinamargulisbacteria bacterium SCGC AG-343-K17]